MKYIFTILLLFFSTRIIEAKTLFTVCADYSNDGNPINSYAEWNIQRSGNFMYIFVKSDQLLTKKYFIRIEKLYGRTDSTFLLFDQFELKKDSSKNWVANKYTFLRSGIYKFLLFENDDNTPVETYYTTILYTDQTYIDDGFTDTWFYRNSTLRFCDSIHNEQLIGTKDIFIAQPKETKITMYISQPDRLELKTDRILAKIYKLENNEKKFLYTDIFFTNYKWRWTF